MCATDILSTLFAPNTITNIEIELKSNCVLAFLWRRSWLCRSNSKTYSHPDFTPAPRQTSWIGAEACWRVNSCQYGAVGVCKLHQFEMQGVAFLVTGLLVLVFIAAWQLSFVCCNLISANEQMLVIYWDVMYYMHSQYVWVCCGFGLRI